jgi:hypothetical protein
LSPTAETVMLYRSMSTSDLEELRAAFEIDQALAQTPDSNAFGEGRIELIGAILAARGKESS